MEECTISHHPDVPPFPPPISPSYCPPEVIRSWHVSVWSNVWAFGVVMYELASGGKVPFEDRSIVQVRMAVLKGDHVRLPAYWPGMVRDGLEKCFEEEPTQRPTFASLHDMLIAAWHSEHAEQEALRRAAARRPSLVPEMRATSPEFLGIMGWSSPSIGPGGGRGGGAGGGGGDDDGGGGDFGGSNLNLMQLPAESEKGSAGMEAEEAEYVEKQREPEEEEVLRGWTSATVGVPHHERSGGGGGGGGSGYGEKQKFIQ